MIAHSVDHDILFDLSACSGVIRQKDSSLLVQGHILYISDDKSDQIHGVIVQHINIGELLLEGFPGFKIIGEQAVIHSHRNDKSLAEILSELGGNAQPAFWIYCMEEFASEQNSITANL